MKSAERLRDAIVKALSKIPARLTPEQRGKLAHLIRTGALLIESKRGVECSPRRVHRSGMSRRTSALLFAFSGSLAAGPLAAGCSGSQEPELPGPGTTALYFESRVGGACELAKVGVSVDGRFLIKMRSPDIAALRGDRKLLAKIPLAPGSHALLLQASARCKGGDPEPQIVTIRDARSFLVSEAPAAVVIEINSIELRGGGVARLDAKLRVRGAELAPAIGLGGTIYEGGEVDAAGVDDRLCTGLPAAGRAICRAEAVLTRARERRDIVSVSCIQEKIAQMRLHAVTIDRAGERSQGGRDPSGDEPDAAVIAMAEERIQAIALEIEYCSGHEAMDPEKGSGVRVLGKP